MKKERVCIILLTNLFRAPYLKVYEEIINETGYDMIYWDRLGIEEKCNAKNTYVFRNITPYDEKYGKLLYKYLLFQKFTNKIIKRNKYTKIFVLGSNTGVILLPILVVRYRKKYVVDIRDYFLENNSLYFTLEKILLKWSYCCIISSEAFKKFLPSGNYYVIHNIPDQRIIKQHKKNSISNINQLRVCCIGAAKYLDEDKKVLQYFANDNRFRIGYYGLDYDMLSEYCAQHNINNVDIEGRFKPERTMDYYDKTDIVLNMYGKHNPHLDYALSNKLYYAAYLKMPILVNTDTEMANVSQKYGFGFALDLDDEEGKDKLYKYYKNINFNKLADNTKEYIKKVEDDNYNAIFVITEFLKMTDTCERADE